MRRRDPSLREVKVVKSIKKYIDRRKQMIRTCGYKMEGESINNAVGNILKQNNTHRVEFLIEHCKRKREEVLEKIQEEPALISNTLHKKIAEKDIVNLHDCEDFGFFLLEIYHQQETDNNPLFTPIYVGRKPILLGEHGSILTVLFMILYIL